MNRPAHPGMTRRPAPPTAQRRAGSAGGVTAGRSTRPPAVTSRPGSPSGWGTASRPSASRGITRAPAGSLSRRLAHGPPVSKAASATPTAGTTSAFSYAPSKGSGGAQTDPGQGPYDVVFDNKWGSVTHHEFATKQEAEKFAAEYRKSVYSLEDGTLKKIEIKSLAPSFGKLTFDAEGKEGGPFHSRKPHVPTDNSGLTIGRGYDLKKRSPKRAFEDLKAAGLPEATAKLYAGAAGLSGQKAKEYIKSHNLPEITRLQQKNLFEISYAEAETDVKRICAKADVVKKYGNADWEKLDPAIKALLVDLRFRGDYTPTSRQLLQRKVAANDPKGFAEVIINRANWPDVPKDRFNRRKAFAEAAVKQTSPALNAPLP
jgi:hypothetical protein